MQTLLVLPSLEFSFGLEMVKPNRTETETEKKRTEKTETEKTEKKKNEKTRNFVAFRKMY